MNFAIIGTGKIVEQFIDAVKQFQNCKIDTVYSRSLEKGQLFAQKFSIPNIVTSIDNIILKKSITAVYVASPNFVHYEQVIKLLNGKKHVLCEKPLGINSTEIEQMFECAKKNNVILMEAMKTAFLPNFEVIRENLKFIEPIRYVNFSFSQYSSKYDDFKNGKIWNIFSSNKGCGTDFDLGVYPLYLSISLFGAPKNWNKKDILLETGVSACGNIILEYTNMIININYSKISNSYIGNEIQGENGTIYIDDISNLRKVILYNRNGQYKNISVSQEKNNMIYEIQEFIDCIKNKKFSKINTIEKVKNIIKIIESKN